MRGSPSLESSGILPEGSSGPAPTGGLLSCANKKVTKEVARGPLPAPWTPGAVVPDLQPLLAFRLEPSSGLSAAWVDTRRPPPFGCCAAEGWGLRGSPPWNFPASRRVGSPWRRGSPFWDFPAARRVGSPWRRGFPSLAFSGILPEGLSGPAPTGGTFLARASPPPCLPSGGGQGGGRRGPLPAPWTPGAVVPDLRPLLAFRLEPSSGLSAAWVDTRRPPPFGCWNWEGGGV